MPILNCQNNASGSCDYLHRVQSIVMQLVCKVTHLGSFFNLHGRVDEYACPWNATQHQVCLELTMILDTVFEVLVSFVVTLFGTGGSRLIVAKIGIEVNMTKRDQSAKVVFRVSEMEEAEIET